ncbi:MnhB domain-containing protein [Candidatus Bipolaricaulota sp. J31]
MKRALGVMALVALTGLLLFGLFPSFPLREVEEGWKELARAYGAENGVAAVVLGARLYDTLLEVLVFALAMVGVRYTLKPLERWREPVIPERGVLREMADILLPVVVVFSLYLAASGHLGPGGGFPAGAIAGSGLLLLAMAKGVERLSHELHEGTLELAKYGAIAGLLSVGIAGFILDLRGGGLLILFNILIVIEVTIGTWVVLHHFASHRGEI